MKVCLPEFGYCVTFNANGKKRAVCLENTTISFENKEFIIKNIDGSIVELWSDGVSVSVSLESLFGEVTDIKREHGLIQGSFIGEVSSVIKSQLEKVKSWRIKNDKK